MSDLTDIQAAQSVKVVGAGSSGTETNPMDVDSNGSAKATLRDPTSGNGVTTSNNGNANNQLLHIQAPDTTTATTALGALSATVSISMAGLNGVGFQISAGTLIGTLVAELSIDGGTTWISTYFFDPSGSSEIGSVVFSSANTTKVYSIVTIGGTSNVRVRVSAYTSGTATALLRAANSTGGSVSSTFGGTTAAFGTVSNNFVTVPNNTITLLLASNPNRKYAYISNNSGSILNIQFGTSTGISSTTGLTIAGKTFFEIRGDNLYTGNIYGFASGNAVISVTEGTP